MLVKDYVDRPEIQQKIKSKLIDCSVSRPGTLVISAIHGLCGVGKSVMAAVIAHDLKIFNFPQWSEMLRELSCRD